MADDNIIYEPRKLFDSELKGKFHDNATAYFDKLVEQSGINVEANRKHVKEYKALSADEKSNKNKLSKWKTYKTLTIVVLVIAVILLVIFLYVFSQGGSVINFVIEAIVCVGLIVGLSILLGKLISPRIKSFSTLTTELRKKTSEKFDECNADLTPLNNLYDWNIPNKIMKQTTPIINLDDYFTPSRLHFLQTKFGALTENDPEESTLSILSGTIQGNPFVLQKMRNHRLGEKTYTGALTITWTTTVRTKDGYRTVPHTQVLTASVTKPCPFYGSDTRLVYGNEAAPDLVFYRKPQGADKMNDKQRANFVKAQEKEMQARHEKTLASKNSFNPLANSEFEAYLHAYNRNNEVQYRLLFTPLAQKNYIDLLTNPNPYGDDFNMVKDHMVTSVASIHSQIIDYVVSPYDFNDWDIDHAKTKFLDICDRFFQGLYFDLAPIISIPEYQLHKPFEEIYKDVLPNNISFHEEEVMANSIDSSCFTPDEADPSLPLILKPIDIHANGKADVVKIHSFSYKTTPMTDLIPRLGGDGHTHLVPVHWVKYDRVDQDFNMVTSPIGGSTSDYGKQLAEGVVGKYLKSYNSVNSSNSSFQRGLFAAALVGGLLFTDKDAEEFNSIFTTGESK